MPNATGEQGVGNSPGIFHLRTFQETLQQMYPWEHWIYHAQSALQRRIGDDQPSPYTTFLTFTHKDLWLHRGKGLYSVNLWNVFAICRKSELRFKQSCYQIQVSKRVDILVRPVICFGLLNRDYVTLQPGFWAPPAFT